MKIVNITKALRQNIQQHKELLMLMLLLTVVGNAGAQLYNNIHYNDLRTIVILPNLTQTQRANEATVNPDTKQFCSNDNYFFISSSTNGPKVKHDYSAYLQFDLSAIPEGAIIDTVDLIIYLNKIKNTSSIFEQGVNLYELSAPRGNNIINIADSSSSAMKLASKKDIDQAIHLQPDVTDGDNWVAKRKGNLYYVLAAEEAETYQYYTERTGVRSKQPKLVIKYHMPANQVRKNNWPQYKYDAQHTGMLAWQSNSAANSFALNNVFSPVNTNFIQSDPILCDNKLVFAYQSSTPPMYRLRAITQQGNLLAETDLRDTIGLIKYGPVADRRSNIYCLTGNTGNTLKVLNSDGLQVIHHKNLEDGAQAIAMPTIGFDGSIYLSTNKGIYAYTPQPECKLKWVYATTNNKLGSVALDEEEGTVFVYDGEVGNITALNGIDGVKKWTTSVTTKFNNDIPVPTVKNGRLYVTNNQRSGNQFNIIHTSNGNIVKTITNSNDVFSQPVAGLTQVFIINNGKLEAYDANGTKQVEVAPVALNAASALATDGNSNVYILNTKQGSQSLTLVVPGMTSNFPSVKIEDAKGYLTGNRLLISAEGNLFAGNNNHIYSFSPQGFAVKDNIVIPFNNADEFNSEYMYRSQGHIKVNGNPMAGHQNVVIHSGSSITFQANFSVKLGATLTCKTGY